MKIVSWQSLGTGASFHYRLKNAVRKVTPEFAKDFLRRLRRRWRAMVRPTVMQCRVRGLLIEIGTSSETEEMRARTYETKEPETLDWIDSHLGSGGVLFDIGANIGVYSLYASKRAPLAIVYAFEPESQNFARLCQNIVLNGANNIVPCNFPLADREVLDYFYVNRLEAGESFHSFSTISDFTGTEGFALRQGSIATTVDMLVGRHRVPQPTLIKLDVDGLEDRILEGSKCALRSPSLRSLLVEWNYHSAAEINLLERRMESFGLVLEARSRWCIEQKGLIGENLIFARADGRT